MEAALGTVFAVDRQLIRDGSYYVVESDGVIVGCGGWSKRRSLYGGDALRAGADPELDPKVDAARVRAFFVHPEWARRGIGRSVMGGMRARNRGGRISPSGNRGHACGRTSLCPIRLRCGGTLLHCDERRPATASGAHVQDHRSRHKAFLAEILIDGVRASCMYNVMPTITVTLTTEAHQRLNKFKAKGQSFSDVILEFVPEQTCGELLDALEKKFAGKKLTDAKLAKAVREGRGRRSTRRSI